MGMHIFLIRHGETAFNTSEPRIRGRIPVPLNEDGLRHADQVGKALEKVPLDAIYYSEVRRAEQTAEGVRRYNPEAQWIEEPLAIDISWGDWSGKAYPEVMTPEEERQFWTNPHAMEIPAGETFYQVLDRIHRLMFKLRKSGHKNVAIVSHGAVLNLFMCYAMRSPLEKFWDYYAKSCSITELEVLDSGEFKLIRFNDTHHLVDEEKKE